MKVPFKLITLVLFFAFCMTLMSQEERHFGSGFNFVNAVGLETPTILKINGNPYRPFGYKQGAITQGGILYEGNYIASVENSGAKLATLTFTVDRKSSPILLSYIKEVKDGDGVDKNELRLVLLPNRPKARGSTFWAMVASEETGVSVIANEQKIDLPPLVMVPLADSGGLTLKIPQTGHPEFSRSFHPDAPGNFLIVIFPTPLGVKISFLMDEVMVVQRGKDE